MRTTATTYAAAGKSVKFRPAFGLTHLARTTSFVWSLGISFSRRHSRVSHLPVSSQIRRWLAALLGVALLAACEDAPTVPRAYVHAAEGELWVALTVPPGVPDLQSWMPYLRAAGPQGSANLQRVRELQAGMERARRAGDVERAHLLEDEAIRVAAGSLTTLPDGRLFLRSFGALDAWLARADAQLGEARLPQLEGAVDAVRADRSAAESALSAGDTAAAVIHLATAALKVREYAPSAVALRVLDRATQRLETQSLNDVNTARAKRLLANAREALLERQDTRALQRALYALQIADGKSAAAVVGAEAAGALCPPDDGRCPEP